jgi:hypothetical protein
MRVLFRRMAAAPVRRRPSLKCSYVHYTTTVASSGIRADSDTAAGVLRTGQNAWSRTSAPCFPLALRATTPGLMKGPSIMTRRLQTRSSQTQNRQVSEQESPNVCVEILDSCSSCPMFYRLTSTRSPRPRAPFKTRPPFPTFPEPLIPFSQKVAKGTKGRGGRKQGVAQPRGGYVRARGRRSGVRGQRSEVGRRSEGKDDGNKRWEVGERRTETGEPGAESQEPRGGGAQSSAVGGGR